MTQEEFKVWRVLMGYSQAEAGRALGLAVRPDGTTCDAVRHYERGTRAVPETVAKLCEYVMRYGPLPAGGDAA
ncbi:hypothetical protein GAY33_01275 [Azospirillum brasilense]|uniref:helix-turn-helix domain-containing protein n=1 Tax=Azospirillum argentinense TaxID=2970906 RepID=UPI00190C97C0|nr:helix-turn-helix transcriptional regulator [Azospirillum argentinense]MBK3797885.1 hypothetical protein [Azospirillum argentinense]